jgi:predicted transcriptional regulator YheO
MSLSDKYNIPQATIKAMIKDGWISCSVPQYEEIAYFYKKQIESGLSSSEAINRTAEVTSVSKRTVYRVVHKFE